LFYRQVSTAADLELLPSQAVVYFDKLAAVKTEEGTWSISGEKTPVTSKILASMSNVFHVISEYSYFPPTGYNTGRVNLSHVLHMLQQYGELQWVVLFEWTRDFFGVNFETARNAVWELVKTGKIEPTNHDTAKIRRQ